jgi:hypothetical protein
LVYIVLYVYAYIYTYVCMQLYRIRVVYYPIINSDAQVVWCPQIHGDAKKRRDVGDFVVRNSGAVIQPIAIQTWIHCMWISRFCHQNLRFIIKISDNPRICHPNPSKLQMLPSESGFVMKIHHNLNRNCLIFLVRLLVLAAQLPLPFSHLFVQSFIGINTWTGPLRAWNGPRGPEIEMSMFSLNALNMGVPNFDSYPNIKLGIHKQKAGI